MHLTVAVCTWNRAALLDQTLAGMRTLAVPPDTTWELLVVDNNSTDDTRGVLKKHVAGGALPLKPLFEPKQGHSNARNCAVAAAAGEYLIWTDDDVLVDPHWLAAYRTAFAAHPDAGFFGGPIDPWFETDPPAWVARNLTRLCTTLVVLPLPPGDRPAGPDERPYGANMAFPTAVLRRFPFDPGLGRLGAALRGGDDATVIEQVRAAGYPGWWVGGARLKHFIPAARMTAKYVGDWFAWDARVREPAEPRGVATLFGRPRWMLRRYAAARVREVLRRPLRDDRWLAAVLEAARWAGKIDAYRAAPAGGG